VAARALRPALVILLPVACLGLTGCVFRHRPLPAPARMPAHYTVGPAWQADGVWYYPSEDFGYSATGIARVIGEHPSETTADGEIFDPSALAAQHQTLQLPAIVRVTNLENGRRLLVRVNDRGPDSPARLIGLTERAAALLGISPDGAARVRVEEDGVLSHRLAEQLGGGDKLAIASAPQDVVQAEELPPPGSGRVASRPVVIGETGTASAADPVPDQLPEQVEQGPAEPGSLWIFAGTFSRFEYANRLAARLTGLSPRVRRVWSGRAESYTVEAGPFTDIPAADAALDQALSRGVTDARIVVE
jgi:rare lipoprotein A